MLAQSSLDDAKKTQTHYYDRKAIQRSLNVGDKVLLLLPTDTNNLLLNGKGPFEIAFDCDYKIILQDGKSKVFHVNLLKKYEDRVQIMAVSVISRSVLGE